ncbi:MAG TPA: helicase-exonuclease AddAB subunit AddA, partial [Clostridiaceae bacterium]|nr:helicase-exonuclease AddAB subunit AddA [Clostridiaceae bacterium]
DILNTDLSKSYSNFDEEINKRLNFEYAYKRASEIPQVLSITEVKNILLEDEYEKSLYPNVKMKKPAFLDQKKTISPAEKGIATHLVMQKIDMEKVNSPEEIKEQVDYMVKRELLSNEEGKAVDENKIYRFFISPLGTRMIKAEKTVKRETEFNMFIESNEIYKELPPEYKNEKIFLRGIIDCYFEENGEIVLIDYKTDYLKDGDEEEIKKKYSIQLDYYSRALEKITGLRVKEKYLYMFYNGSTIIVD